MSNTKIEITLYDSTGDRRGQVQLPAVPAVGSVLDRAGVYYKVERLLFKTNGTVHALVGGVNADEAIP